MPCARAQAAMGSTPRTGRTAPSSASSRRTGSPPRLGIEHAGGAQHANRDRHVECSAVLSQVGRRQVHGDPARRQLEAAVLERAADADAPLLHARVGQANDVAAGQSDGDVDLDIESAPLRSQRRRLT